MRLSALYLLLLQSSTSSAAGLTITTSALNDAVFGETGATTLQATGGAAPYTWEIVSGAPTGASITDADLIYDDIEQVGVFAALVVRVTDAVMNTADSEALTLYVYPPAPTFSSPAHNSQPADLTPDLVLADPGCGTVDTDFSTNFRLATDIGMSSVVQNSSGHDSLTWTPTTLINGAQLYYADAWLTADGLAGEHSSVLIFNPMVMLTDLTFAVDDSAPLDDPYAGAGSIGQFDPVQTDGQFSTSSGNLNVPAQSTPVSGDLGGQFEPTAGGAHTRSAGIAIVGRVNFSTLSNSSVPFGVTWCVNDTINLVSGGAGNKFGLRFKDTNLVAYGGTGNGGNQLLPLVTGVDYDFVILLHDSTDSAGSIFVRADEGTWRRLWYASAPAVGTAPYAAFANGAHVGTLDVVRVLAVGGDVATDRYGADLDKTSSIVTTETHAISARTVLTVVMTAANPMSGIGFRILHHRSDANNYHVMEIDSSGTFKAYKVVAGTPTDYSTPISVASVGANGGTRGMRLISYDGYWSFGTAGSAALTSIATFTDRGVITGETFNQDATDMEVQFASGYSCSLLRSLPVEEAAWGGLSNLFLAV